MVQRPESDTERKERRIDLSLPQVAGSAVAAVAAAVMASQLGVYGTILGAGVMSVVATCGGSVFQHFFRRTGEQIREVTVQVKHPEGRQVTVRTRETTRPARAERPAADDATTVLRTRDPDRTHLLASLPEQTRLLKAGLPDGAFSDGGTHGTRIRGWKRSALVAVAVFAMAMAGITTYELISGNDLSGGRGTTVGSVVSGGERSGAPAGPASSSDSGTGTGTGAGQDGNRADPGDGSSSAPGTVPDDGGDRQDPAPAQSDGSGAEPSAPESSGDDATGPEATPAPSAPGDGATVAPEPTGSAAGGAATQEDGATADPETGR